ncbi:hypothetical protein O0L34_g8706 [Tuta absoluta]|nr:hypothetical protein O0L34_g8706 [Tuta absoluta]
MGKTTHVDGDNNPTSPECDPAKLLEAALLQMDGIIAEAGGTTTPNSGEGGMTTGPGRAARARALELAQQLASALQHAIPPPPRPDFTTASAILRWLQQNNNSVALVSTPLTNSCIPDGLQLPSALQHAIPPPPRPDFTTASAILRWLQQNNNSVALVSTPLTDSCIPDGLQLPSALQHAIPPPPRPDFTTASAILRWLQQNNNSVALVSTPLTDSCIPDGLQLPSALQHAIPPPPRPDFTTASAILRWLQQNNNSVALVSTPLTNSCIPDGLQLPSALQHAIPPPPRPDFTTASAILRWLQQNNNSVALVSTPLTDSCIPDGLQLASALQHAILRWLQQNNNSVALVSTPLTDSCIPDGLQLPSALQHAIPPPPRPDFTTASAILRWLQQNNNSVALVSTPLTDSFIPDGLQLASALQHAIPPPPRPDFTTASAILRWLQQNNNSVALVSTPLTDSCIPDGLQLTSALQHAIPPPPRPDFTTASAILRWLQQNNNSVALVSTPLTNSCTSIPDGLQLTSALQLPAPAR